MPVECYFGQASQHLYKCLSSLLFHFFFYFFFQFIYFLFLFAHHATIRKIDKIDTGQQLFVILVLGEGMMEDDKNAALTGTKIGMYGDLVQIRAVFFCSFVDVNFRLLVVISLFLT